VRNFWASLAAIAVVATIWLVCGKLMWLAPAFVPSLGEVIKAGAIILSQASIYEDLWATAYRAFFGLFISLMIGVPLGLIFGRFANLYRFAAFPIDFLRSVPSSALFFLFILAFGIGDISKVAVVVYGCSLVILIGALYGAQPNREREDRLSVLRVFGASRLQLFYLVILRDALPQIAAATRVAVSLALVLVIVTEMFLGATEGLGRRLYDYYLAYRIPEMYVLLILLGCLGYLSNLIAVGFERRLAFWSPESN
jgi:ABC-type nitrate/sulfonate/bicarbonate transport system permease component